VAADIIDLSDGTLADDQIDGLAVILDIEPVTDIQAFSVDRKLLICQSIG
jgi:hypothetical protein